MKALEFLYDLRIKTKLDEEIISEHIVYDLDEAIAELESQEKLIEDMKCCGNCEHESLDEDGICICNIGCFALSKWELTK